MNNQSQCEKIAGKYLNDSFYLNTQKPISLYQKVKSKLIKYTKPFAFGISIYLSFEIIKNIVIKAFNFILEAYSYTGQLFGSWLESITNSLLNYSATSETQQCAGILSVIEHSCSTYRAHTITELINIFSYILAIGFFIKSGIKFKEYYNTKGKIPLSQPIVYIMVAALLFALPTLFATSTDVIFSGPPAGNLLNTPQ